MITNEDGPARSAARDDPWEAEEHLEALRWPDGPVCPHCASHAASWRIRRRADGSRPVTSRLWKCAVCRKQFTVTVGTMLENAKAPAEKWLRAFHLLCREVSGVSTRALASELGLTPKSALLMSRRIRRALAIDPLRALWISSARAHAAASASEGRNSRERRRLREILESSRRRPAFAWPPPGSGSREASPLSLWPMCPREALAAFLRINPRSMPGG